MSKYKKHVFATRRGQFWLKSFIFVVILVVMGAALSIASKITYVVTPEIQEQSVLVNIKIDLTTSEPLYGLNIIPGRSLKLGENTSIFERQGLGVFYMDNQAIVYKIEHWEKLIYEVASANRVGGKKLLGQPLIHQESDWQTNSKMLAYQASFKIEQKTMNNFPIDEWEKQLTSIDTKQALDWLRLQPGVLLVKKSDRSSFLANISLKVLRIPPQVIIILDI